MADETLGTAGTVADIVIHRASGETDSSALASLLRALEGTPDVAAIRRIDAAAAELCRATCGDRRPFALLARAGSGPPVGCATLSAFFPAPDGHWGLYLEELYVSPAGRRRGVATALLGAAADMAIREGYERMFWTTTPDNAPALALYGRLLGDASGKIHFQADGDPLRALAARRPSNTGP